MVWAMNLSLQPGLPGECMPHTQSHEAQRGCVEISVPAEAPWAVFYAPWDVLSEEHLDSHPFAFAQGSSADVQMARSAQHEPRFQAVGVENMRRCRKLRQGSLALKPQRLPTLSVSFVRKDPYLPPVKTHLVWLLASAKV